MKRRFNNFVKYMTRFRIVKKWKTKKKEERILYIMLLINMIIFGIIIFVNIDTIPATSSDYEPLEMQVNAIQQEPDLLLKTDCNINITNEVIMVNIENDECELIAKYDQNFDILSISKKDKCRGWLLALVISLVLGCICGNLGSILILIIVIFVEVGLKAFKLKIGKK